ncbi:MAG: AsmA family protein [Hyphomicrobiales bacterium]
MRLIFSILMAIVVIAAAIFFIGPMFISADDIRQQLFAQVESATGYRLRVSGPVDVTLFPSLDLVAEDVGIAQPAVGGDKEFATAKTLKFGLMLQGLLDGKMRMTEVTLIDPVIAVPKQPAQAPAGAAPNAGGGGSAGGGGGATSVADKLKNLTLDELVIKNGTVILPPSGETPGKRIEKLDLEASLPAYDQALSFDAAAVVDGKAMKAEGSIGKFGHFLEGAPAPVSITADAPGTLDAPASLSGTATYKDDTLTFSQFNAKSGDKTLVGTAVYKDDTVTLSQFTATAGRDSFAGNASYKNNIVVVNPLRANLRGTLFSGWVKADLSNKVPNVEAALAAKTLDVNALTKMPKSKPSGGGGGGGGGGSGGNAGWSNAPIDFSPLRSVNGKFALSAEQLIYDQVTVAPVTLQATLSGGKLNASLSKFNLYGGAGNAVVAVDASGKTPAQRVQLALANLDAYPFLRDAAGFENIEGKATINLDLSGAGASQRAIVSTLNGTSNIEFKNGAIRGVNIAKMLRNLGTGIVNGWQGGTAEKTDFASLGASFKVAKGNASTNDLHLAGPLVRMTGAGTVDLPAKKLNFKVDPQLVASLEGQGGKKDLAGLGVPVMIVGPWAHPKIYPDIKGILENPQAAIERFKQFGDGMSNLPGADKVDQVKAFKDVVKDGKVNQDALMEGIGGLLGGSQATGATTPEATATPDAAPDATAPTDKKKSRKKAANKDKKSKQQAAESQKLDTEDAAKQILENFLGGQ